MKKILSRLTYTLIIGLMLINTACPEGCNIYSTDPTGVWELTRTYDGQTDTIQVIFSGKKKHGEVYYLGYYVGNYKHEGNFSWQMMLPDEIEWDFEYFLEFYLGDFDSDSDDYISGDFYIYDDPVIEGTFTGRKIDEI